MFLRNNINLSYLKFGISLNNITKLPLEFSDFLKNNRVLVKLKIQTEGHTAGDTPVKTLKPAYKHLGDEWNYTGSAKKLSKLRAGTVKKYLVNKGISSSRVLTEGYGATQKRIQNPKTKEEKALNMRVEVKIINRGEGKEYSIQNTTPPVD